MVIVGPGSLSYAGDGTLERVAERRVQNHWGLTGDWTAYDVLSAPSDCQLLDKAGWLIVEGKILTVKVVDCENKDHAGQMKERGLLADTNLPQLVHQRAWLVLR